MKLCYILIISALAVSARISVKKCEEYKKLYEEENGYALSDPDPILSSQTYTPPPTYECDFHDGMIVGGEDAARGEFPHMAAVGWLNEATQEIKFKCGGSLISERYVLTAAHCKHKKLKRYFVRLQSNSIAERSIMETSDYEVERFITHEKYSNFTKKYDIGLLKLNRDVVFYDKTYRDENPNESFGIPACLQQDAFTDVNVTATGWGKNHTEGERLKSLMKVNLHHRNSTDCDRIGGHLDDSQICAGMSTDDQKKPVGARPDTCVGDSGGPIQVRSEVDCVYLIIGVTSYGIQGCGTIAPAVYTNVSYFVDWIESHVWPSNDIVPTATKLSEN